MTGFPPPLPQPASGAAAKALQDVWAAEANYDEEFASYLFSCQEDEKAREVEGRKLLREASVLEPCRKPGFII